MINLQLFSFMPSKTPTTLPHLHSIPPSLQFPLTSILPSHFAIKLGQQFEACFWNPPFWSLDKLSHLGKTQTIALESNLLASAP